MTKLALASVSAGGPTAQWAHDIRNTLATIGLHLETLERLSGTRGRQIALAAHDLMSRAAGMCSEAMAHDQTDAASRRRGFDLTKTVSQVANLLRATAPQGLEIRVFGTGSFAVLANQQDAFRIVFNLLHNAIAVARKQPEGARMTNVTLLVERSGPMVTVRVVDDGPGLPQAVRASLFRRKTSRAGGNGMGLAIAREFAERNGGVLRLAESARGTTFVLELAALASTHSDGAMRSLGTRVQLQAVEPGAVTTIRMHRVGSAEA